ncbi:MAG TPA: hypothetical protein VGC97_20605 [Pyrinomonadaceae bacterium]|jgi:hypothetical protein
MHSGKNRKDEKGAAMVMVLMITMLLLAAVGGLLLEVSMNTANVTDATAEQQAYNAAESGIQSAINVLRGNTTPSVLLDASKPSSDPANLINFRRAVTTSSSNLNGEATSVARLSRWMSYNYTPSGADMADRITLVPAAEYTPRTGYAFDVSVVDPDKTGNIISFKAEGKIYDPNEKKWKSSVTIDGVTITYSGLDVSPKTIDVTSGSANTNYGSFQFSGSGDIPQNLRFEVLVEMTAPYSISRGLRGYIKKTDKVESGAYNNVGFDFDSQISQLMGSTITLDSDVMYPTAAGKMTVSANMTQAEPFRVVVTATGYGPRGAKKVLEATIQKNFFNGMTAPATLTLVGPAAGSVFEPGSSNETEYSGQDKVSSVIIPPIGTTNDANLDLVLDKTLKAPPHPFNGNIVGTSANVNSEMPFWLQNPRNLNSTIQSLKLTARSSNRYFASGTVPSDTGDNVSGRGITFVDGDLKLTPELSGGGILVVTGKLTLKGNFNFKGLIIVIGSGGVERDGGGTGILQGNIVIAPYDATKLDDDFLPPKYDLSGGGNSAVQYNSNSVANGMIAVSNFVLGVAEK